MGRRFQYWSASVTPFGAAMAHVVTVTLGLWQQRSTNLESRWGRMAPRVRNLDPPPCGDPFCSDCRSRRGPSSRLTPPSVSGQH